MSQKNAFMYMYILYMYFFLIYIVFKTVLANFSTHQMHRFAEKNQKIGNSHTLRFIFDHLELFLQINISE